MRVVLPIVDNSACQSSSAVLFLPILYLALPMVSSEDVRYLTHIHHPPSLQYFQFLSVEPATLRMFLSLKISRFLFASIQLPFISTHELFDG